MLTLVSEQMSFITCWPSTPEALAMLPISLAKVTFTARQEFDAYFTASAVRSVTTLDGTGISALISLRIASVRASSAPKTMRPGS